MKDAQGNTIYVGKAKDLHRRLASYFSPTGATLANHKTRALINAIASFDYFETRNDHEAFLLESKLIKQYRPHYNIQLKDDKRYPLLKIPKGERLPRFQLSRVRKEDGARYFGPFVHSQALYATQEWLNRHFRLRTCKVKNPGLNDFKHCHADVIRNCSAPCVGRISVENYNRNFEQAVRLLEGVGKKNALDALTEEMMQAADSLDFERAAYLRNIRDNLIKTLEPARRFQRLDQVIPDIPQVRGAFKVQTVGGLHHFFSQRVQRVLLPHSFQQAHGLFKVSVVVFHGDAAYARRGTVADDVRMAVLEVVQSGIFHFAGAEPEMSVEPFLGGVQGLGMDKGAEVARAVLLAYPGELEARQAFPLGNFQEGIALVVLELDVVMGPVLLDELAFQQEGLVIVAGFKIVKGGDGVDECAGLVVGQRGSGRGKVARQAAVKVLRLSYVNGIALGILHNVDSGFVRSLSPKLLQCWCFMICHTAIMP